MGIFCTSDIKSAMTLVISYFSLIKTEIIYFYEGFKTFCEPTLTMQHGYSFILKQEWIFN